MIKCRNLENKHRNTTIPFFVSLCLSDPELRTENVNRNNFNKMKN